MTDLPDSNPKTKYGITKPALGLIPLAALQAASGAHALGAAKYGPWNWREHSVAASVYVNAILRHLKAWQECSDTDTESGVSHLGHVMACCGILLDAQACGTLVDDRPIKPRSENNEYIPHVLATCDLLLDAEAKGKLVDNRPKKGLHNADHK